MLKDPSNQHGSLSPYDLLAPVGITPESSMKEVMDASFDLMAQGLMTPEVRQAWDELRLPQRRFFVDFFLYNLDPSTELAEAGEGLEGLDVEIEPADLSNLLKVDLSELQRMDQDFRDILVDPPDISFLPELDLAPPLPGGPRG